MMGTARRPGRAERKEAPMHPLKVALGVVMLAATPLVSGRAVGAAGAVAVVPPACAPGQLAVWIDTQGNGAAGSVYYHLQFTNISVHSCTLTGYPGVSAVNAAGRRLGRPASRSVLHPTRRVSLSGAPFAEGGPIGLGATATAVLRILNVDNYPAARCGRATAVGLRVYAPNQSVAKFVSLPLLACTHPTAPFLSVESVQPQP